MWQTSTAGSQKRSWQAQSQPTGWSQLHTASGEGSRMTVAWIGSRVAIERTSDRAGPRLGPPARVPVWSQGRQATVAVRMGYSFRAVSPRRTRPDRTTRVFAPRSRRCR
jgi:hypothetical protein